MQRNFRYWEVFGVIAGVIIAVVTTAAIAPEFAVIVLVILAAAGGLLLALWQPANRTTPNPPAGPTSATPASHLAPESHQGPALAAARDIHYTSIVNPPPPASNARSPTLRTSRERNADRQRAKAMREAKELAALREANARPLPPPTRPAEGKALAKSASFELGTASATLPMPARKEASDYAAHPPQPPQPRRSCDLANYMMKKGDLNEILLDANSGETVKGWLRETAGQKFNWRAVNDDGLTALLNRGNAKRLGGSRKPLVRHGVNLALPKEMSGRWYLVLDARRATINRTVEVDLMTHPSPPSSPPLPRAIRWDQ